MKYKLEYADGNAFVVIGYVTGAMIAEKFPQSEIEECRRKAMSSDYGNLIYESVVMIDKCKAQYDETHAYEDDYDNECNYPQYDECDGEYNFV